MSEIFFKRQNKSFARRVGKSLSDSQKHLLKNVLPKYLLHPSDIIPKDDTRYIAEIGIGMGEHFVSRAFSASNNEIHLGFEPYLNGISNSLRLAEEKCLNNILLWPDDVDLAMHLLPDNLLSEICIFFPDPWPKKYQHKRRIFNAHRLGIFIKKMKNRGILRFASDILDYLEQAKRVIEDSKSFDNLSISDSPYLGYVKTKYHIKAEQDGRNAYFLETHLSKD